MTKSNAKGKTASHASAKGSLKHSKKDVGQENPPKPTPEKTEEDKKTSESPKVDIKELVQTTFASLAPEAAQELGKKRDEILKRYLQERVQFHEISKQYNILILHDELRMVKSDADNIYAAARGFSETKPLLLILHSTGGHVGSAYLIGKLCREYSGDKLVVVVPRRAKSVKRDALKLLPEFCTGEQ